MKSWQGGDNNRVISSCGMWLTLYTVWITNVHVSMCTGKSEEATGKQNQGNPLISTTDTPRTFSSLLRRGYWEFDWCYLWQDEDLSVHLKQFMLASQQG